MSDITETRMHRSLNRLTKWRSVFAGWFLGSRDGDDEQCRAYRDLTDARLVMRVELTAIVGLLIDKGVLTAEEFQNAVANEADLYSRDLESVFPGFKATDTGMHLDTPKVAVTTRNWPK